MAGEPSHRFGAWDSTGGGNVRVSINVPKFKKSPLPIPTYDATTMEDAVNGFVAWPKRLVELDTSMNKAS
ncbi:hypothetical protein TIFTF001_037903 [Ficus carica]|uniref:DUF8039 domain-containing protein n=1 Tax=Ficus carica TaxID=3494 RepID=A0AA88EHP2_FICCA|nr:hypothetical protein TIFTF001_037903 [Ficus carica]